MGGCWCRNPHHDPGLETPADKRAAKQGRVRSGRAHAALVFDEDGLAQGWTQYGSLDELTVKRHRRHGVARAALKGAVDLIAHTGGGRVEAVSPSIRGRKPAAAFLFSASVGPFEENGFERLRQVGKHSWTVGRVVEPA